MSDELSNATRIAALEEQVRTLTADAAAFNSIMNRGQEWMNSAHDSWKRMCNQREEAREALTKALADNATLNTAKDRLIDERNACLRELDATRQALDNARSWIDGQDVRSDFKNATAMRQALDRERERCGVLERECRKFRERYIEKCEFDAGTVSHTIWYLALAKELETAMAETDTRHALDAAKFGKEQNDG